AGSREEASTVRRRVSGLSHTCSGGFALNISALCPAWYRLAGPRTAQEVTTTMKRVALYSRSGASGRTQPTDSTAPATSKSPPPAASPAAEATRERRAWRALAQRHRGALLFLAGGLFAVLLVLGLGGYAPPVAPLTQEDIDKAVLHTLRARAVPSAPAKAYEVIRPSVVRVRGLARGDNREDLTEPSVGSGAVSVDSGIILTSLHVVA